MIHILIVIVRESHNIIQLDVKVCHITSILTPIVTQPEQVHNYRERKAQIKKREALHVKLNEIFCNSSKPCITSSDPNAHEI